MPHTWPSSPTDNEVMLYWYRKGGSVITREIVASRVQAPPAFCSEAKVAKGGGGIFAGHYGTYTYHYIIIVCVSYLEDGIFVHVCFLFGGVV